VHGDDDADRLVQPLHILVHHLVVPEEGQRFVTQVLHEDRAGCVVRVVDLGSEATGVVDKGDVCHLATQHHWIGVPFQNE